MTELTSKIIDLLRKIKANAQTGLHFTSNPFEVERYREITDLSAEIVNELSDKDIPEVKLIFEEDHGYATPKVDVRGCIIQDNKILLVKETADGGRWTLPGGWADVNLSPAENVIREIREESGFESKVLRLIAVHDRNLHNRPITTLVHIYKMFFLSEITGGEACKSIETGGAEFFDPGSLPELSVSRTTAEQIRMAFRHHNNPNLNCEFD